MIVLLKETEVHIIIVYMNMKTPMFLFPLFSFKPSHD